MTGQLGRVLSPLLVLHSQAELTTGLIGELQSRNSLDGWIFASGRYDGLIPHAAPS